MKLFIYRTTHNHLHMVKLDMLSDHATVEIHVRTVYVRYSIAINRVHVSEKFIYLV
jgi:hypothetical protein